MKQQENTNLCEWGHDICTAPNTQCPHWQGTFCELDLLNQALLKYEKLMQKE